MAMIAAQMPSFMRVTPPCSLSPPVPPHSTRDHQAQAHPKLGKQVEYLGKLVRATVQAMAAQPAQ